MFDFGSIVLVPFPFTDLSSAKVRPALVISKSDAAGRDVIVCFITSQPKTPSPSDLPLAATPKSGLKVASTVRFDKIATLDRRIILGELGRIDPRVLRGHRERFLDAFGF